MISERNGKLTYQVAGTNHCWRHVMHRSFITSVLWLSLILSTHGTSLEIPVTSTNLDQSKYRFAISTNVATNRIAFHVTITGKGEDVPSDSVVSLSIVAHTQNGSHSTRSIEGVEPPVEMRLGKDRRVWTADFTVSRKLLKKPGLCLVFTELAHTIVDGRRVFMPSAQFYEFRLKDFLKK